ncbi:MAG: glycosyltransferase family 4 protein [Methanomicrobiaceae archaeon]|nr:glycosyltransferase family 4 protein [Methanomicrobiaceae archaeon]
MTSSLNSKSKVHIQGDYQLSELVGTILPGDPSQYSVAILISVFLKSEGASRVAELQAKELSKMGYSVVVYTFESDMPPGGYKVEIIGSWVQTYAQHLVKPYRAVFPFNLWKSLKISSNLKETSLIILHQETLVTAAHLTKKYYGTKLIFWHHHITESRFMTLKGRFYGLIVSPFNWRKIKEFDLVVSISEHSRNVLRSEKGVDSIVIYDEIDSNRFNESNLNGVSIRKKYNINSDDRVILFVGRITPTKNIHSLISIFKTVKMRIPSVKLIIVGKNYDNQYAENLMRDCDPNVIFAGFVPDEELPNYYAACDVYATCSLVEGFNMPLVEAQACGKSIVAFDIGPHKEVVRNGFLVDPGNVDMFGATLIRSLNAQK